MTQKQFKDALLRGQGRCVYAAQADPEKYFSQVLWACDHEIAFDAQCEGTRSGFVYRLIRCYEDRSPFFRAVLAAFRKTTSTSGWRMLYLAELLSFFAGDGEETAEQALWQKYQELYGLLYARKRARSGIFPERDDFSMLCLILGQRNAAMVRIAEDIGRLYREKPFYDGWDFDWLYATCAKRHMRALKKQALVSENIAAYLRAGQAADENAAQSRSGKALSELSGLALSLKLSRTGDPDTVRQHAEAYLAQTAPEARAKALEVFIICPFPLDPQPIIEDADSPIEDLRSAAWRALEKIRHPAVRSFAMERLQRDKENALPLFIVNYRPQDAAQLTALVKSIPVDRRGDALWHGIQMDVLHMADHRIKAPAELLRFTYETTYCSCCRHTAVQQMGKRRLLTDALLRECLHDSNDEIRNYAKQALRRRQKTV